MFCLSTFKVNTKQGFITWSHNPKESQVIIFIPIIDEKEKGKSLHEVEIKSEGALISLIHLKQFFSSTITVSEKLLKDVHIVVPFTYLLLSYSKFEWAENATVQARTKKLSGIQICCMTKWFLWKLHNLSHL